MLPANDSTNDFLSASPRTEPFFPKELRQHARWICWSVGLSTAGKPTKRPHGSTRTPSDWLQFDDVSGSLCTTQSGLGFVFTGGVCTAGGWFLLAVDADACRDPATGALSSWATELLDAFPNTTAEVSPSGTGLRLLLLVPVRPAPIAIIRVPASAPPGVDKHPQIQVFGCGPAGYVTLTGNTLPGRDIEPSEFADVTWLFRRFGGAERTAGSLSEHLPTGWGPVPSFQEIAARLAKDPNMGELVAGRWENRGLESASEGWWQLSRAALRAANGHGAQAAEFLIEHTAYGQGDVDSRDPARYARADWVELDLCRIAGKTGDVGPEVFADGFDPAHWSPPLPQAPIDGDPWTIQLAALVAGAAHQNFLFKGLLPSRGIAQVFGDSGSGKTPFAVSWALHVACGLDWMGFPLRRRGAVLYMIGEDASGMAGRLRAQLLVTDPLVDLDRVPVYCSTRPGALRDAGNRQRWVAEIRAAMRRTEDTERAARVALNGSALTDYRAPELAMVVVDTQNRNFGAGNENDTEDMSGFVDQLVLLGRELDCLIVLVHHTGHAEKERARGSSVLFGSLDACFEVTRNGRAVTLTSKKAKNWAEPQPVFAGLVPVVIGEDEDGSPVTAITLSPDVPSPVDVFDEQENVGLAKLLRFLQSTEGRPTSWIQIQESCGITRKICRTQIEDLRGKCFLTVKATIPRRPQSYFVTTKGVDFLVQYPDEKSNS